MRSFITGASGFVGSHIAESLRNQGEDVVALVRKTSNTEFLNKIGVKLCCVSLDDTDALEEALSGCDKVYHSAALADELISPQIAHQTNVVGTRNLLEASKRKNIKRFIHISSLGVFGMHDHHATKADAPQERCGHAYIDSKIGAEEVVREYQKEHGLPVTIVRPGFVFGPRDPKFIPRIIDKLKNNKFMFVGDGKNKVNIVYIDNLISAVNLAAEKESAIGQAYNVTNDSGMDIESFIFSVSDVWGINRPTKHLPKALAYVLCSILEGGAKLVRSKKPPYVTKTRLKLLTLNLDFDIEKTKNELGYRPTVGIEEGLKRTRDWIEKENIAA